MLTGLVRSEVRQAVILLVFAGLLVETLTPATIALVIIGSVLVWFKKRTSRIFRNILTLGIFVSYWITYGKVIDPEIGLNFLTSIIVLKLLEKETIRDSYMIFFGLVLLVSAGSLFEKSLMYILFFGMSFFLMLEDFYRNLHLPMRVRSLLQSLVWVLPFTAFLFFLVPRMMNPFQLSKGTPGKGEIGYSPEVNMDQVESLSSNDSPVFQAQVDGPIEREDLYWRGNVLTFSDGWNWPVMPQDRFLIDFKDTFRNISKDSIKQKIRAFSKQDYFFGFDTPSYFISPRGSAELTSARTLSQQRWKPNQRYEVVSSTKPIVEKSAQLQKDMASGLKPTERKWINETFKAETLPELQEEIENYFQRHKFSYSLSPGRVDSFLSFMIGKKIGFCSHYASAVAQIFRTKNIPSRLVSGFMGGSYNRFAGFYLVTQNDAHVWVEALHEGKWQRLDPTSWIAPERVQLGGEAFMEQQEKGALAPLRGLTSQFRFLHDFKQWFEQWDFKLYQWLEEMDYHGQAALLDKLNLQRNWVFSLIPIILALFIGLYSWYLGRSQTKISEIEKLWLSFQGKLKSKGIELPLFSVSEGEKILKDEDEVVRSIWKELVMISFTAKTSSETVTLKRKINAL